MLWSPWDVRAFWNRISGGAAALFLVAAAATYSESSTMTILAYIKRTWTELTRSNQDLASRAVDPKFHPSADGRWSVYVSRDEDIRRVERELRRVTKASDFLKVDIRALPQNPAAVREQGLLYLPRPYVVPGGRFNEMYGWDSYFILMGLLRDGEVELAKDMAENFLYEIERVRQGTQCQPHLLPDPLPASVPHGDDARVSIARAHDRAWLGDSAARHREVLSILDQRAAPDPEHGPVALLRRGRRDPAPEVVSGENATAAAGRTTTGSASTTGHHRINEYDV